MTSSSGVGAVHPIYARLLHLLLQQAEVDSDKVLAAAALDWQSLLHSEQRLGRETVIQLVRAAQKATGRPWLGLELGSQAPVSAHGPVGYAAVTAPNLHHSLEMVARYGTTREASFTWTLHNTPTGCALKAVAQWDWEDAHHFMVDTLAAALVRLLQAAVGTIPTGAWLELPFPAPSWEARYHRTLAMELRFSQAALALHLPRSALEMACIGADAQAHVAACQACEAAMQALGTGSLAQRVATLLTQVPQGHYPQLSEIALSCGKSERTLMRHLALEGTSFQQLLDAHQKSRALEWLAHSTLGVEEIAERLGYTDTSNFSRTVKRWFGHTPSELRKRTP
jgi:AraC-like DNA-binding protein